MSPATMFITKDYADKILWGKYEGDNKQMGVHQSMISGFVAGCPGKLSHCMPVEKHASACMKVWRESALLKSRKGLRFELLDNYETWALSFTKQVWC